MIAVRTLKCPLILTGLTAWLDASKPHSRTALRTWWALNKKRYWLECVGLRHGCIFILTAENNLSAKAAVDYLTHRARKPLRCQPLSQYALNFDTGLPHD
jgi:hypothetical protein